MKLRPYKPCDAEVILSWIKDEQTFRRWSTDRYDHYPITAADINHKYLDCNGDCPQPDKRDRTADLLNAMASGCGQNEYIWIKWTK